jgi:hypothetical protein
MPHDDDIWRLTARLLAKYGRGTGNEVARRLNRARQDGDKEGLAVWRSVGRALMELARKPDKDDSVN